MYPFGMPKTVLWKFASCSWATHGWQTQTDPLLCHLLVAAAAVAVVVVVVATTTTTTVAVAGLGIKASIQKTREIVA